MRGLPYDCTPQQVLDFFASGDNPVHVFDGAEGVLFVRKPTGKATGDAFVLFAEESDAPKALSKHRHLIGKRYIELFRSTTAEVQQVLNNSMEATPKYPLVATVPPIPAAMATTFQLATPTGAVPQHVIMSGTRKDCVRLRGLPYEAQVEHILDFLGEYAKYILYQGVHMVYNAQGQPSGEAFIQMDSEQSAYQTAQNKHHRYMVYGKKQRYIEVFQCSGEDMNQILTGGLPPAPVSPAKVPPLLSPGGNILAAPAFANGFPANAAFPPALQLAPRQFLGPPPAAAAPPPAIFYWPHPSPPVSPTGYYPAMGPPTLATPQPGGHPPPQHQQQIVPIECLALPSMPPTIDARLLQDGLNRSDQDRSAQTFHPPNQYVEIII